MPSVFLRCSKPGLAELFGKGLAHAGFHHVLHGRERKTKFGAEMHLLRHQADAAGYTGAFEAQFIVLPLAGQAVFLGQPGGDLVNCGTCLRHFKCGGVDDIDAAHVLWGRQDVWKAAL